MKKIDPKIILIVTLLLMVSFAFYWLQIRPALIIKTCSKESEGLLDVEIRFLTELKQEGFSKEEAIDALAEIRKNTYTPEEFEEQKEDAFEKCLRSKGLFNEA